MKSRELREKRAKCIADARAILDTADAEKRELKIEEREHYDKIMLDADTLGKDIERIEKLEAAERDLDQPLREHRAGRDATDPAPVGELRLGAFSAPEYRKAFSGYLRTGAIPSEYRALQADADVQGGFLVAPEQFSTSLIKFVDDLVFIRSFSDKETVLKAEKLGVATLDADPADSDWTSEIGTGSEDATMAFGKRELEPHPLAKRIKVSNKLLRVASQDVEAIILQRLAYKFAITEEKAFMTGSGAGRPLGVFTASPDGISTARDEATDNTATAPTFDGLINAQYKLKGAYWGRARWIFHRDVLKVVRKIKDGNGQYIWQPSVLAGQPDSLLNMPVHMSEYAPNTMTTGLYVGIVGDFMLYKIVDALTMTVQRLIELYAETNQTGFIGRLECDGMPVLEEAFVRVKLA